MITAHDVEAIITAIRPLLAGRPPEVQGAVLADLTATWLASHFSTDANKTVALREQLLVMHIEFVRRLIPLNELPRDNREDR